MSVWPSLPGSHAPLAGSEGALVSICVPVPPRDLESLLDALAHLDFPINPQIYHDASVDHVYADGSEQSEPATLVEFPAYESQLGAVKGALTAYGFPEDAVHVVEMLSDIRSDAIVEPAPPEAPYVTRIFRKHAGLCAAGPH